MKKAKNLGKQAIGDTKDLAITFKDKKLKKKENNNNEYYNYYKFGHFGQDYFFPDRWLNRNTE